MANEVRLIDANDGALLERKSICYESLQAPRFSAWAAGAGGRLRAEMESAYASVAEEIQRMLAGEQTRAKVDEVDPCSRLVAKAEEGPVTPIEPEGR